MCDSSTMAMISMGTQLLGGAMGAKGSYDQASANREGYAIHAAVARQNARIAEQQATLSEENGRVVEGNTRLRTGQVVGSQRAALAANGVDLGEGSPNDILTTSAFMGERDALTVRDTALRTAWGYRVQGANASNNASIYDLASEASNPGLAATTSLLTTATSVAGTWYGAKKQGIKMPWEG